MSSKRTSIKLLQFSAAIVFAGALFLPLLTQKTNAADLLYRTIQIGSSIPSEVTTHSYSFQTVDATTVGSIRFQYCSNSPLFVDPCTAPAGLNVSGAGILNETGLTGFAVSGVSTASDLIISRAPQAEVATPASFIFDNVINPSTSNEIDYVRIYIYDGVDGTGTALDQGAVAFVVDDTYDISAYVPPYLTFCVGVTVALDCSTTTGFLADFGEFSEFAATTATTQMSGSTNDGNGYNVFVSGQTLTSGANVIPSLIANTASQPGTSQFGINLRANTNPSVGSNPQAGPVAAGAPAPNYNIPNLFRFISGERVAGSTQSTGFNRYTVSYMVNVSQDQRPGLYAATLTYTSIATF